MRILTFLFYAVVITSPFWVFMLFMLWLFGAFDSCHPDLIHSCP